MLISDIGTFIEDHSTGIGISLNLISIGIGLKIENNYNIINRVHKYIAYKKNQEAEIDLAIRFKISKNFDEIKVELKNKLIQKYKNYRLFRESDIELSMGFDVFTIEVINTKSDEVFIDVLRTSVMSIA